MKESQDSDRFGILLEAYAGKTASVEQVRALFRLLDENGADETLKKAVLQSLRSDETAGMERGVSGEQAGLPTASDPVWLGIASTIRRRRRRPLKKLALSAGALALAIGLVAVLRPVGGHRNGWLKADVAVMPAKTKPDVAPGTSKAVLTLANGEKIWLDSAKNGSLAAQGNAEVVKIGHGQLVYTAGVGTGGPANLFNSIATPRGGQYQVRLPDGTQVWLNASSSLRYPTCFPGPDRRVELTGEAYFEVAKNASHPFHVLIGGTDIQVLGTHFNVMGYANEKEVKTTLLEGKVNVTTSGSTKKLVPGNEATVRADQSSILVKPGFPEQAVAWKNGLFRFRETSIRSIMRQVERWYDVDVEFRTEAKGQDFTGVVSRSENLSALLQTLELTGTVHFRIEGKRVIVLP